MYFEQDYLLIKKYTESVLGRLNKKMKSADEVVSESYIKFVESGEHYTLSVFKKIIFCQAKILNRNKEGTYFNEDDSFRSKGIYEKEKCCIGCKKLLPNSEFFVHKKFASGHIEYFSRCKDCQRELNRINRQKKASSDPEWHQRQKDNAKKKQKERYKLMMSNPRLKEHFQNENRRRVKEYYEKNKTEKLAYIKMYKQLKRAN